MLNRFTTHLTPLASPQIVQLVLVILTLIALFAAPHAVHAQPIGGGVGS